MVSSPLLLRSLSCFLRSYLTRLPQEAKKAELKLLKKPCQNEPNSHLMGQKNINHRNSYQIRMMWPFRQTQIPYHFYIIFLMRVLACSLIFTPKFTLLQNRFLGAARNPLQGRFGQPPLSNRLQKSCICRGGSQAAPINCLICRGGW